MRLPGDDGTALVFSIDALPNEAPPECELPHPER
jgi:hypothetical protein